MAYEELKSSGITADTPKNIMLRAIKKKSFDKVKAEELKKQYNDTLNFLLGK